MKRDEFNFNRSIAVSIVLAALATVAVHFWMYR